MKIRLLGLLVLFVFYESNGQSTTDEMLGAPLVRNYIQLIPDFKNRQFYYTIDEAGPSSHSKTLKNLTLGVPTKRREIALTMVFYNPLRFSIKTSDVLLNDPSYESIGKLAAALTGLLGTLPNVTPPETQALAGDPPSQLIGSDRGAAANPDITIPLGSDGKFRTKDVLETNKKQKKAQPEVNFTTSDSWTQKINSIRSEDLAEWKVLSFYGNMGCINTDSRIVKKLIEIDQRYFNASVRGVVRRYLTALSKPDDINTFQTENSRFKVILDSLDLVNRRNIDLLKEFSGLISGDISGDLLERNVKNESYCASFVIYSQIVFKRFLRARSEFQQKRNEMISLARLINEEANTLISKAVTLPNGSKVFENAIIINRYDIRNDKMRDISITMQERKMNLLASPPSITDTENRFAGKLRIRAAQTLVLEFSGGAFLTSLQYPIFTVVLKDGVSVIGKEDVSYKFGGAGMMNMTVNAINGLAHPLLQIGVGTGKDRPTILTGAGIRFSAKVPLIFTIGSVWQFQQTLINKKLGEEIRDATQLKENVQYEFNPKPALYLGFQLKALTF